MGYMSFGGISSTCRSHCDGGPRQDLQDSGTSKGNGTCVCTQHKFTSYFLLCQSDTHTGRSCCDIGCRNSPCEDGWSVSCAGTHHVRMDGVGAVQELTM